MGLLTGVEIKQAAAAYCAESIDDEHALEAINRAISQLADMALVYDVLTVVDAAANTWCDLPETLVNIVHVEDSEGSAYTGYWQMGGKIKFADAGTYTVHYRRMPQRLTGILGTPETHPIFDDVIVTYVIAWWKLMDDDENPDGLRHMEMFRVQAKEAYTMLRRKRTPSAIRVIR